MKDTITDLYDRMALLHNRYTVVFQTPPAMAALEPQFASAVLLDEALRGGAEKAVQVTRAVVDPADLDRAEFWGTPLGRLLFTAGGYTGETCTQTVAAGVLGCSRQWVNAMVAERKLASAADRGVYVAQVRGILKARIDRLVK